MEIKNREPDFMNYVKSGINGLKNVPYQDHGVGDEMFTCADLKIIPEIKSVSNLVRDQ